jgi:hypothetical protein
MELRQSMSIDFTIDKYTDLCEAIALSGYTPLTVQAYLEAKDLPARLVVVRHDVDASPRNEPKIALVESDFGIRATYYFRYKPNIFRPDVMQKIAAMGHEIGYHYETLDRAKGDLKRALEMFKSELAAFREVADIKSVSMHGNPLTQWDNRDLWREYDVRDYGILGEAYLSFHDIIYLTDTGRTWSPAYKVKDMLPQDAKGEGGSQIAPKVRSTDDVIKLIETGQYSRLYLNTHAGRWGTSSLDWATSVVKDAAVNIVKLGIAMKTRGKQKAD